MRLYNPTSPSWLILFAHHIHAHVKLEQPVPYGAASLNTNPLNQDGSDWPCKQRPSVYDISQWNIMPVNSVQTISFQGQATHGGGACQISLTRDTPPTANSVFKVIKSIEGGCPSTNPGNVGTDPFGYGADEFNFTIPNAITPANYTLAWTWFNKIGDREMYMNCVPITVTSSSGSKKRHLHRRRHGIVEQRTDAMDGLPDMFRANSGNGCSTAPSGTVLAIPAENLGANVERIGTEPSFCFSDCFIFDASGIFYNAVGTPNIFNASYAISSTRSPSLDFRDANGYLPYPWKIGVFARWNSVGNVHGGPSSVLSTRSYRNEV
ncbi:hypothetical protein P7C71_g2923, partial [Lecanoromycetidae sp. Uapishka_2]